LASASQPEKSISVELAGVNDREIVVEEELYALLEIHDLSPWIFTSRIRIEAGVIPHSHPILTLNTRHSGDQNRLLAVFLHEQIHWFLADPENRSAVHAALAEIRNIYPKVPGARDGGAAKENSTYLHLIVNWLERDALVQLLGPEKARATIEETDIYEWIYGEVLENGSQVGSIITGNGLRIER
jgi:hypothetical protein